jgi:hypothetical protein
LIRKGFNWLLSRLPFYSLFFIFPVLGMMNCQGWNEGSMSSETCLINSSLLQAYADFYYALILFSSFMLLLPLVVYIVIAIWLSEVFGRKLAGE